MTLEFLIGMMIGMYPIQGIQHKMICKDMTWGQAYLSALLIVPVMLIFHGIVNLFFGLNFWAFQEWV